MKGEIYIGSEVKPAGRMGDAPAIGLIKFAYDLQDKVIKFYKTGLANTLASLALKMAKLKTGTPPRLKKDSIDFKVCEKQFADNPPSPFSFLNTQVWIKVIRK